MPRPKTEVETKVEKEVIETEVLKAPPEEAELKTKVDLKDLRTGWLFENENNELLVVRHDREDKIVRTVNLPVGPGLPSGPFRQITHVPRSDSVIYEIGEHMDDPDRKRSKGMKNISFEDFCGLIKEKGYRFVKVI